jgi:hypothetical protein
LTIAQLFDPIPVAEQQFLLASHLPQGRFWELAFDTNDNFGKLFLGLAVEFYRFQVLERKLFDEMDIEKADELLIDWEKSVGLPDACFETVGVTVEQRKLQVLQKFSKFQGVQKKEDFIRVASVFGFDINILTGTAVATFPLEFPIVFSSSTKAAKHTLFIILLDNPETNADFPLPFPIPFSTGGRQFLQCIFEALAPANVEVIIKNEGEI